MAEFLSTGPMSLFVDLTVSTISACITALVELQSQALESHIPDSVGLMLYWSTSIGVRLYRGIARAHRKDSPRDVLIMGRLMAVFRQCERLPSRLSGSVLLVQMLLKTINTGTPTAGGSSAAVRAPVSNAAAPSWTNVPDDDLDAANALEEFNDHDIDGLLDDDDMLALEYDLIAGPSASGSCSPLSEASCTDAGAAEKRENMQAPMELEHHAECMDKDDMDECSETSEHMGDAAKPLEGHSERDVDEDAARVPLALRIVRLLQAAKHVLHEERNAGNGDFVVASVCFCEDVVLMCA